MLQTNSLNSEQYLWFKAEDNKEDDDEEKTVYLQSKFILDRDKFSPYHPFV